MAKLLALITALLLLAAVNVSCDDMIVKHFPEGTYVIDSEHNHPYFQGLKT